MQVSSMMNKLTEVSEDIDVGRDVQPIMHKAGIGATLAFCTISVISPGGACAYIGITEITALFVLKLTQRGDLSGFTNKCACLAIPVSVGLIAGWPVITIASAIGIRLLASIPINMANQWVELLPIKHELKPLKLNQGALSSLSAKTFIVTPAVIGGATCCLFPFFAPLQLAAAVGISNLTEQMLRRYAPSISNLSASRMTYLYASPLGKVCCLTGGILLGSWSIAHGVAVLGAVILANQVYSFAESDAKFKARS